MSGTGEVGPGEAAPLPGEAAPEEPATPFGDLARYVEIPRVGGLRLAPDGTWLAAVVQTLSDDRKKYVSSIWRLPAHPGDDTPPRRLTWSADGEKNPSSARTVRCSTSPSARPAGPAEDGKAPTRPPCGACPPGAAKPSAWPRCRAG